ncbi:RYamide receptor [Cimex lectularius]|uniref:G-protein coupled receptors family 1 profile domain-containing protein n=1 Tax=Cimex lectularius TaxID=79782 RepID=A0A8I6TJE1_CIMLE|nr:RYamide receptor [Cimex lectularius]
MSELEWVHLEEYNETDNHTIDCTIVGPEGLLSSGYFQTAVYCLYIVIFVIALCGNGLVCYVVQSSPRMRTVTNFFIGNLAVGDIFMALLCVPFSCVPNLLQYWPFGLQFCRLVSYSQAVSVLVSAYTLVAISVDRYMAILWPLKPRMSKSMAKLIILTVWLIAVATALPISYVTKLKKPLNSPWHEECDRYVCAEVWNSNDARHLYSYSLLSLQYVVPLLVLLYTYTSIAVVVWGKSTPGEAETSRDMRMAKSKRKMIIMMVTVVVVFTICWLPFNILLLVWEANPNIELWQGLPFLYFALHWLAMSHACYNPLIYCWLNARFRSAFCLTLKKLSCKRKPPPDQLLHRINTCTTYISMHRAKHRSKSSCLEQQI